MSFSTRFESRDRGFECPGTLNRSSRVEFFGSISLAVLNTRCGLFKLTTRGPKLDYSHSCFITMFISHLPHYPDPYPLVTLPPFLHARQDNRMHQSAFVEFMWNKSHTPQLMCTTGFVPDIRGLPLSSINGQSAFSMNTRTLVNRHEIWR